MGGTTVVEARASSSRGLPASYPSRAPSTGGENDRVLRDLLGYDDDAITSLVAAGALE
jgi:crotonobetainyl-CoA:carnitine CoA-transferase CaiB-like acyl-CoA transferase